MTSRVFPFSRCFSSRTLPVPRSFHSAVSLTNLNSLARKLKTCSSDSSFVLMSDFSDSWTMGSKWISLDSGSSCYAAGPVSKW